VNDYDSENWTPAMLVNRCEELEDKIKELEAENAKLTKDWCDDDDAIKQQALRVLDPKRIEGDTWHVPRMVELAEMLADEVERLRDENAKLKEAIADWRLVTSVHGGHRTCLCAVCERLVKAVSDE